MLVAPAMLIPLHTDSVGAASEHFWVNAGFPFSLRTQGVTLSVSSSSLKLGSTNGLKIEG